MSNITLNLATPSGKPVILTLTGDCPDTISVDGAPAVGVDRLCQIAGRGIINAIPAAKALIDPDQVYYQAIYTVNGKRGACYLDRDGSDRLHTAINAHREAARAARDALLAANVPGLDVLRNAINDWAYYHDQFRRAMEDEYNDGVNMPRQPTADVEAIEAQYPRAALWVRADAYEDASNYHKASAGRKAKQMIEAGDNLDACRDVLDNWLPPEAMWD